MKKTMFMLVLLAASIGCAPPFTVEYTVQGTVRNVWCHIDSCDITFEHETGEVTDLILKNPVPLWAGEHVRIKLATNHSGFPDRIVSTQRLP